MIFFVKKIIEKMYIGVPSLWYMFSIFPFRFFTNWSLLFHALFLLGLIENTFTLAVFVILGSIVLTHCLIQEEPYDWVSDIGLHYLPLLMFVFTGIDWNWDSFWLCWIAYLSYTWGDIPQILTWYEEPMYYFFHEEKEKEEEQEARKPIFQLRDREDVLKLLYLADEFTRYE